MTLTEYLMDIAEHGDMEILKRLVTKLNDTEYDGDWPYESTVADAINVIAHVGYLYFGVDDE